MNLSLWFSKSIYEIESGEKLLCNARFNVHRYFHQSKMILQRNEFQVCRMKLSVKWNLTVLLSDLHSSELSHRNPDLHPNKHPIFKWNKKLFEIKKNALLNQAQVSYFILNSIIFILFNFSNYSQIILKKSSLFLQSSLSFEFRRNPLFHFTIKLNHQPIYFFYFPRKIKETTGNPARVA